MPAWGWDREGQESGLFGRPSPAENGLPERHTTDRRALSRGDQDSGWGETPLPGMGGSFEACTKRGGAEARWRGGRRAKEFLNKRNVTGKGHGRNKRKLPARSESEKQLLAKVSGRKVKGRQGRAVEGLVCLGTAAGLDSYTRVLSPGSSRMPWGVKKRTEVPEPRRSESSVQGRG